LSISFKWYRSFFSRSKEKTKLPPAIHALLLQIVSVFINLLMLLLSSVMLTNSLPLFFYVLAQAAFAAFFSFLRGMDWWWLIIQFFFPIFIVVSLFLEISSIYYLSGFILFSLAYWSTFRTQVPYYPSKASLLPEILKLCRIDRPIRFIDIGSGLGGLLIRLSSVMPSSHFVGIEIAPLLWFISYLRGKLFRSQVNFILGDYEKINFGEYDIVFAYLSPAAMPDLWSKVQREMTAGSLLLSFEFPVPDATPDLCIKIAMNDPILYVWRI
jgi:hypothetical protein